MSQPATAPFVRVALITGAGQGIGRSIALRLCEDGLDIAVNDLPSSASQLDSLRSEIASSGRKCIVIPADISQEDQVKAMIDLVVLEMGHLDVLVANAGISLPPVPLVQTSIDFWDTHFSVNARGTFLCYKYAAEQMLAQGYGGRIVGASSIVGKQAGAGLGAYSATKAAIRSLTQTAAQEFGSYGITVNAFSAGVISTPMFDKLMDIFTQASLSSPLLTEINRPADRVAAITAHLSDMEANKCAAKRLGMPTDIANLVSMLIRPESSFITGQCINCDGGRVFD